MHTRLYAIAATLVLTAVLELELALAQYVEGSSRALAGFLAKHSRLVSIDQETSRIVIRDCEGVVVASFAPTAVAWRPAD